MKTYKDNFLILKRCLLFITLLIVIINTLFATEPVDSMYLVWSDDFNGEILDPKFWTADEKAESYYCSTGRPENVLVKDGHLYLTARKESYQVWESTSGIIRTYDKVAWTYGRIEARIKLLTVPNLTAAFWIVYENGHYGWWPTSGEIDIFEVFTGNVNKIWGNIGTEKYNHIFGEDVCQGSIEIENADTEFHIYALDWNGDSISFFVDNMLFFTFKNDHAGYKNWPYDQPFHIILSLACDYEYNTDSASMVTDYVRVYQKLDDTGISGNQYVYFNMSETYRGPIIDGAVYQWSVPADAQILSGQGSDRINVQWNETGGDVELTLTKDGYTTDISYPVTVTQNVLLNGDFTGDIKYWLPGSYPWGARFFLEDVPGPLDGNFIKAEVYDPGDNPGVTCLQRFDVELNNPGVYEGSFWAVSWKGNAEVDAFFVNGEEPYNTVFSKHFEIKGSWQEYPFTFTTMENYKGLFKLDIGYQADTILFDKFSLNIAEPCIPAIPDHRNIIENGDFELCNLNSWNLFQVYNENSKGTLSLNDGTCSITDITISDEPVGWFIQLMQQFTEDQRQRLKMDSVYVLSFEASSIKEGRPLHVYLGLDEPPNTTLIYEEIDLNASMEEYSYEFTYTSEMSSIRLSFELGFNTSSVTFDNIRLIRKEIDTDSDGIEDFMDNCPGIPNETQTDSDSDDIGNSCDNCPDIANYDQADIDGNGIGDDCEISTSGFNNKFDFNNSVIDYNIITKTIKVSDIDDRSNYEIFNMDGKLLMCGNIDNEGVIDVSDLNRGIYFIIISNKGNITPFKLIK